MNANKFFILDFDSTFTKVEALDELAEIALQNSPNRDEVVAQIRHITNLGMEGRVSFRESLVERVKLLKANRAHLDELVKRLRDKVSDSVRRNTVVLRSLLLP
jgi:D-3-phosphoglycerate dehydrogenase